MSLSEKELNQLDEFWEDVFPDNIKFLKLGIVTEFPTALFQDEEFNCAYSIERYKITSSLRIWLKENVEQQLFIISRDHSGYYGLNFFFTDPEDATKFALKFGDIIKKFEG